MSALIIQIRKHDYCKLYSKILKKMVEKNFFEIVSKIVELIDRSG